MRRLVARDVMNPEVLTVREDMTVQEAATILVENEISGAPVEDAEGKLVGVVFLDRYRDEHRRQRRHPGRPPEPGLLRPRLGSRFSPEEMTKEGLHVESEGLPVREIMTAALYSVPEETPVSKIAETMIDGHVHRLLVTRDNQVVGIITTSDLLGLLIETERWPLPDCLRAAGRTAAPPARSATAGWRAGRRARGAGRAGPQVGLALGELIGQATEEPGLMRDLEMGARHRGRGLRTAHRLGNQRIERPVLLGVVGQQALFEKLAQCCELVSLLPGAFVQHIVRAGRRGCRGTTREAGALEADDDRQHVAERRGEGVERHQRGESFCQHAFDAMHGFSGPHKWTCSLSD